MFRSFVLVSLFFIVVSCQNSSIPLSNSSFFSSSSSSSSLAPRSNNTKANMTNTTNTTTPTTPTPTPAVSGLMCNLLSGRAFPVGAAYSTLGCNSCICRQVSSTYANFTCNTYKCPSNQYCIDWNTGRNALDQSKYNLDACRTCTCSVADQGYKPGSCITSAVCAADSAPDIFLIVVVVVMAILVAGAMFLITIVYGSPDDKNAAKFPKFVTVSGLWLAFASLLVLPYDVAAGETGGSGIRVDILWEIIYCVLAFYIVFLIPFSFFFYESDQDPDAEAEAEGFFDTQAGEALKYTIIFAAIMLIFLGIMYSQLAYADIPYYYIGYNTNNNLVLQPLSTPRSYFFNASSISLGPGPIPSLAYSTAPTKKLLTIPISFILYMIAFVGFIGWFFLMLFGGAGLIALPMDLINDFRTRPTPISTKDFFAARADLGRRAIALLDLGKQLQRSQDKADASRSEKRETSSTLLVFEKQYYFLKKDYQLLHIAHKLKGGNPLIPFFKLIAGSIGACISVAWIIHICVFVLPPVPASPFLNTFFITLESINGFPLFGVIAFAIFSFYLLCAVVMGNFKVGVRFLLFKLYPMEIGNTLMNAFLFNTWFILICALPTVQFCVAAFPYYTQNTEASVMFGSQIRYMRFFYWFYAFNAFIIALVIIAVIATLVFFICPTNKADQVEEKLKKLATTKSTALSDINDL